MKIFLLLAALAGGVATNPEPVESAFSNMQARQADQCSFTRWFRDGDTSTVERFDADLETWALLEIDGRAPSAKALDEYSDDWANRARRNLPTAIDFDDLAAPGSYKRLEASDDQAVYEFAPGAETEDDQKISDALIGRLVINEEEQSVAYFEISNARAFSPAFGVKIKSLNQRVEFRWLENQRVFVMGEVTVKMAGRAFGLKKISQDMVVSFDKFSCE